MYSSGRLHRLRDLQPPVIVVPDPGLCVQNVACDGSAHFTFAKVHFKVVQAKIIKFPIHLYCVAFLLLTGHCRLVIIHSLPTTTCSNLRMLKQHTSWSTCKSLIA